MGNAEKTLTGLYALLKEQKVQEAVALCATAFGATEAQVWELAKRVSLGGLHDIALAIARTLDASDEERPMQALALSMTGQAEFTLDPDNANRPIVIEVARRLAKLSR
ncbi:hypothetical protein [Corallococcus coralloides]|uniref:hypothetical protein n=1 Tax=Corallococcus coralloides TaxID=184914 RepID=UPI0005BBC75B|nr:hypothetical protein [Corallococcus coralloides]